MVGYVHGSTTTRKLGPQIEHDYEADPLGLPQEKMHVKVPDTEIMDNEKYYTVADLTGRNINLGSGGHGNHHHKDQIIASNHHHEGQSIASNHHHEVQSIAGRQPTS